MSEVIDTTVAEETTEEKREKEVKELQEVVETCTNGYLVAVLPDGTLTFRRMGTQEGYIELMGLHKLAEYKLNVLSDINQQWGAALTSLQLNQLGQMLQAVLQMLTNQAKQQFSIK